MSLVNKYFIKHFLKIPFSKHIWLGNEDILLPFRMRTLEMVAPS